MGYRNIKKQKKTYFFIQIEDFDFSMSRDNAYYQFYKNAPYGTMAVFEELEILDKYLGVNPSIWRLTNN